jgi:hypothetical protein
MSEQRAHPRYAIELDAQLEMPGGVAIRGRTQDISRGGFCLLAPTDVPQVEVSTVCSIRLALVFSENEFSEQLTLSGAIAWYTKLKQGTQVGVKFAQLDAQSRGYLDLFIKFLEDGRERDAEDEPEETGPGD